MCLLLRTHCWTHHFLMLQLLVSGDADQVMPAHQNHRAPLGAGTVTVALSAATDMTTRSIRICSVLGFVSLLLSSQTVLWFHAVCSSCKRNEWDSSFSPQADPKLVMPGLHSHHNLRNLGVALQTFERLAVLHTKNLSSVSSRWRSPALDEGNSRGCVLSLGLA